MLCDGDLSKDLTDGLGPERRNFRLHRFGALYRRPVCAKTQQQQQQRLKDYAPQEATVSPQAWMCCFVLLCSQCNLCGLCSVAAMGEQR